MTVSITTSGSAHLAPSGLAIGVPSLAGSSSVSIENAIVRPSGDHARLPGACGRSAMRAVAPVAIQRM